MTDDLPFTQPPDRPALGAKPRCRRHVWRYADPTPDCAVFEPHLHQRCARCGVVKDEARSHRGRTSRNRGNSIEREIGKRLGLRRVGQFGGADDLSGEMFAAQVKSGTAFPERMWSWLKAVPVTAGQTALLVVTDAPGAGHRRRAVVVLDIDDWISLHGPTETAA